MITHREAALIEAIERITGTMDELAHMAKAGNSKPPVEQLAHVIYGASMFAKHVREQEDIPDTMGAGWNRPAPASMESLVSVLEDAAERVAIGDSFEGTITWVMPTDEPELEGHDFGLIARYRIGNLDGQGGLRVFQGDAGS